MKDIFIHYALLNFGLAFILHGGHGYYGYNIGSFISKFLICCVIVIS